VDRRTLIGRLLASRRALIAGQPVPSRRPAEAEGGCGVIGIACSEPLPGRHLLQALAQMRNRGNGKGGGVALVGLVPEEFGVTRQVLAEDYLLAVAYLDPSARMEVERDFVEPLFLVDHSVHFSVDGGSDLPVRPPQVTAYFVRVQPEVCEAFGREHRLSDAPRETIEDELVYQNSYRLNTALYSSLGEKRAFILSHGKDLLVLKMVGYGDDVVRAYALRDVHARVWIGHHRYPTKGRVWHPGGAHPFVGLHEALVHNGDFANYASVCAYLAQQRIYPLFLTDTEVSVLMFDLLHRTYGYPLEYVIEALAPTTERDFALLPSEKRRLYRMLQTVHIHGSPDGPWFFLIAQSERNAGGPRIARLIGITDTSMLRPQVFALQQRGPEGPAIGLAASEKQAIDAVLESVAAEDDRFWARADRIWNARGGSHTDGGAFAFSVSRSDSGDGRLVCTDKFGRVIEGEDGGRRYFRAGYPSKAEGAIGSPSEGRRLAPFRHEGTAADLFRLVVDEIPGWSPDDLVAFRDGLVRDLDGDEQRRLALEVLTLLVDRRYPTGALRRSALLCQLDEGLAAVFESVKAAPSPGFVFHRWMGHPPEPGSPDQVLVIDARGFPAEGPESLALEITRLVRRGFRRVVVAHARGHRFIASALGPNTGGVRIDVYGSSGDYLASGIDGATVVVHGTAQDQLAQIMKAGRLIVHGDVGQTFMYAAKGGEVFVLGNAAGRPLINAVGSPRVVINGTCLDYLAESFMAGDPLNGGGFVVLNGVAFGPNGCLRDLDTPYPGCNLFSLASGGAVFIRDPDRRVGEDQLNGGQFGAFTSAHWELLRPVLEENERVFGIPVDRLLGASGAALQPDRVYRMVIPSRVRALQAEQAWVAQH
jgi:glutamate synthase domain-containing protein 1/glutamate synthase domain-containing protein 3